MNRRKALQVVGNIGATLLATPAFPDLLHICQLLHEEELLAVCAAYIPICWRLYFDGYLSEVQSLLPICTSQLAVLTRQKSAKSPKRAALLASQAHQLACMLALQSLDYGSAFIQADEAQHYAIIAESSDLHIASLIRQAFPWDDLPLLRVRRMHTRSPGAIDRAKKEGPQLVVARNAPTPQMQPHLAMVCILWPQIVVNLPSTFSPFNRARGTTDPNTSNAAIPCNGVYPLAANHH